MFSLIALLGAYLWVDVRMLGDTALNLTLTNGSFVLPFGLWVLSVINKFSLKKSTFTKVKELELGNKP